MDSAQDLSTTGGPSLTEPPQRHAVRDYARLHVKWFEDPVLGAASRIEPACFVLWPVLVAWCHQVSHVDDNPDGVLHTSPADLADIVHQPEDRVRAALELLAEGELATVEPAPLGTVRIALTRFHKWQTPRFSPAARTQAWRDREQAKRAPAKRSRDGMVTSRDVERELELERELERREEGQDSKGPSSPPAKPARGVPPLEDVRTVFDHWRNTFGLNGNAKLDDKRTRRIRWALSTYGMQTALRVIDGYAADDWEDRRKHCGIELLFRSATHVERGLDLADKKQRPTTPQEEQARGKYSRNLISFG